MEQKIAAGIVLFNPNIDRLFENIKALIPQINILILVDNHSDNLLSVKQAIEAEKSLFSNKKLKIIENPDNLGIAAALNSICKEAINQGADWVLTMDQDSVCADKLIEKYEEHKNLQGVASLCCIINDRSGALQYEKDVWSGDYREVEATITSANYISLSAWKKIGGFDERYFIDKVDTDYCFRLVLAGYKIVQINYPGMLHEIGNHATDHKLFGYPFIVFNHSPFRAYHLIRNQIFFARKFESVKGKKWAKRIKRTAWTRIIVYLLYEKHKIAKLKAWVRGLKDGYSMPL